MSGTLLERNISLEKIFCFFEKKIFVKCLLQGQVRYRVPAGGHEVGREGRRHGRPHDDQPEPGGAGALPGRLGGSLLLLPDGPEVRLPASADLSSGGPVRVPRPGQSGALAMVQITPDTLL